MKLVAAAQSVVAVAVLGLTGYRCFEQSALNYGDVFQPSILHRSETLQQYDALCGIACLIMVLAVLVEEATKTKSFAPVRPSIVTVFTLPLAAILALLLLLAMGAPSQGVKLSGTCHLAVVFGTAAVYPWLMVAGFNGSLWQQLVHARIRSIPQAYPLYFAIAGSLLGAIPIPLDWTEPWQTYPAPIHFGMAVGLLLGSLWPMLTSMK